MDVVTSIDPLLIKYAPNAIGFILPPIVEILNKDIPVDKKLTFKLWKFSVAIKERYLATLAICFCTAVLLKLNDLQVSTLDDIFASFGIIFTESQFVYTTYFKDSNLREGIQDKFMKKEDPLISPDNPLSDGLAG